jgi:hypothetical protein
MKELIEIIKTDLTCLYETDKIENAVNFNKILGKELISENFIPMYFTGKYDAPTVFVMLNPGSQLNTSYSFSKNEKSNYENVDDFVSKYVEKNINIGKIDFDRLDNFDLKQAAFLLPFQDSGISLPNFTLDLKNRELKLKAKEAVLMQKLQLELIPYHSAKFDELLSNENIAKNNIDLFLPHINRLLNVITSEDRKYVIFGAKQFYYLFKAFQNKFPESIEFKETKSLKIEGLKNKTNLSLIQFNHNNKRIKGLIAHSFPRRDLPNAYEKMRKYGELCFNEFSKSI